MKRKPLTVRQVFVSEGEVRRKRLQEAVDAYLRLALESGVHGGARDAAATREDGGGRP